MLQLCAVWCDGANIELPACSDETTKFVAALYGRAGKFSESLKLCDGWARRQEPVLFEDILCQLHDMVKPAHQSRFHLSDLKGCKLAGNFFNILFNLNKFIAFETRDPFVIRQVRDTPLLASPSLMPLSPALSFRRNTPDAFSAYGG